MGGGVTLTTGWIVRIDGRRVRVVRSSLLRPWKSSGWFESLVEEKRPRLPDDEERPRLELTVLQHSGSDSAGEPGTPSDDTSPKRDKTPER